MADYTYSSNKTWCSTVARFMRLTSRVIIVLTLIILLQLVATIRGEIAPAPKGVLVLLPNQPAHQSDLDIMRGIQSVVSQDPSKPVILYIEHIDQQPDAAGR